MCTLIKPGLQQHSTQHSSPVPLLSRGSAHSAELHAHETHSAASPKSSACRAFHTYPTRGEGASSGGSGPRPPAARGGHTRPCPSSRRPLPSAEMQAVGPAVAPAQQLGSGSADGDLRALARRSQGGGLGNGRDFLDCSSSRPECWKRYVRVRRAGSGEGRGGPPLPCCRSTRGASERYTSPQLPLHAEGGYRGLHVGRHQPLPSLRLRSLQSCPQASNAVQALPCGLRWTCC